MRRWLARGYARVSTLPKYALCLKARQSFGVKLREAITLVILLIRADAAPAYKQPLV
jgi:hypothetical protein